MTLKLPK